LEPVNIDPRDGGGPTAAVTSVPEAPGRFRRRTFNVVVLEGRFGIRAVAPAAGIADPGRGPRVILRCGLVAAPVSAGVAALVSTLAATEPTAAESAAVATAKAALSTLAAGALGAVDLGVGVAQARADFIDFELERCAFRLLLFRRNGS
jgi:hypothetical protein